MVISQRMRLCVTVKAGQRFVKTQGERGEVSHVEALLSDTLPDEGEVVDDESFAGDSAQGVAVVAVPRLVEQGVLVDVGGVVETRQGVSYPLVGEEGGEPRGADQQEDDRLDGRGTEERGYEGRGERERKMQRRRKDRGKEKCRGI